MLTMLEFNGGQFVVTRPAVGLWVVEVTSHVTIPRGFATADECSAYLHANGVRPMDAELADRLAVRRSR